MKFVKKMNSKLLQKLKSMMKRKPVWFLILIMVFSGFVYLLKNVFFSLILMASLGLMAYVIVQYLINKENK